MAHRVVYICDNCKTETPSSPTMAPPVNWGGINLTRIDSQPSGWNSYEMGDYLICGACINEMRDRFPFVNTRELKKS